jgi:hypothetical protein
MPQERYGHQSGSSRWKVVTGLNNSVYSDAGSSQEVNRFMSGIRGLLRDQLS